LSIRENKIKGPKQGMNVFSKNVRTILVLELKDFKNQNKGLKCE
jgi:hypothetical protein